MVRRCEERVRWCEKKGATVRWCEKGSTVRWCDGPTVRRWEKKGPTVRRCDGATVRWCVVGWWIFLPSNLRTAGPSYLFNHFTIFDLTLCEWNRTGMYN